MADIPTRTLSNRVIATIALISPSAARHALPESCLRADLDLDHIDRVHLGLQLEDEFGVRLRDAEIHGWDTVADIARSIECASGREHASS